MKLNCDSTFEEIENFLLFHMENADDRQSKLNPILTKQQVWDINMGGVIRRSVRIREIIVKNIIKEFGNFYE